MPITEIRVGPQVAQDGANLTARAGKTGEMMVTDAHGRYYEAASRGRLFHAANTAAQATSTASATATGLILSNPVGSSTQLVVLDIAVGVGAVVAAVFEVGLFEAPLTTGAAVTHTTPITVKNCLIGSSYVGVGLVDSAATLPVAPVHCRTLLASGWVTATAQSQEFASWDVAGAIILLPNTNISIQSVVGTQSIIASILWEEVPL